MEQKIINFLHDHGFSYYVPIPNESLQNIYELLMKNKKFEPMTDIEMLYMGIAGINLARHYQRKFDYDVAIEYYLMCIENKFSRSNDLLVKCCMNLAECYTHVPNHDGVTKYYLLAFEYGSLNAIKELANYCEHRLDYNNMIKYYLVAFNYVPKNDSIEKIFDEQFFVYLELGWFEVGNLFRKIKNMYDSKMKLLIHHFKYLPGAEGFMAARLEKYNEEN